MFLSRRPGVFATHHLPAIGWAALLAFLLLMPAGGGGEPSAPMAWMFGMSSYWMDITGHLVCSGVMGWLAGRSMGALGLAGAMVVAIAVSALYGALLELGQIPIPGRGFEVLDVMTNTVGATIGAWIQAVYASSRTH